MVFMEDGTSMGNALKICPSRRNEGSTMVVVDKSFKSSLCDDGEEREEQVGDHLVANGEVIEIPPENDGHIERFGKDGKYSKRERCMFRKWWKNHIL